MTIWAKSRGKRLQEIGFAQNNNFAQPFARPIMSVVLGVGLAQMVLDVQKIFAPTQFYMLNNICFNNFAQKSSPGGVLALGLLLAVYGPGLGPDGPGGQEES